MGKTSASFRARLMGGAAAAVLMISAGSAAAQEVAKFDIAPQPLADALKQFGYQSGHGVLASPALADAKVSRGVAGEQDVEIALNQLLDGSGLTWKRNGDTFLIVSASDPQSGSAAGDGAEGTVQALVVTAQKREENIQDVPIAMSAFSQEDLTRSQVAGGPDLMTQVPNFTFTKTNFSGYSIQIRGIGTQAISATTDPAVAVAFNNTPFIRNRFFEQEFYDLERVEVLRGPQGTLYGRNATAGVVNIISAKPKNHFEARIAADMANYNSTRLEGMLNLPLVQDKAALRIAGAWTKRNGFVTNTLTGKQTDGRDLWSTRVTLGLTPTDNFKANLIWEHFSENDDRLRSGKQLCHKDMGPAEVNGVPVAQTADPVFAGPITAAHFSQGCLPASLYSPDSFQTPNGYSLAYYGAAAGIGAPVYGNLDPYLHATQSNNLREIETHLTPDYEASNDTIELQLQLQLPNSLTFTSETGFNRDKIFSFEDYNRFDTTPGVFVPDAPDFTRIHEDGTFCDPQLGCTNRLAAGDLSTAESEQFSQEVRVSSAFEGPMNFSVGANFLRYDTEDKYYVFINSLTAFVSGFSNPWVPGVSDNSVRMESDPNQEQDDKYGYAWSDPNKFYSVANVNYIDPNDIHHLNDEGRNYFLSKNPYHLLSYAVFGEAYYNITPSLKLTGGFRWTVDRKTAPQIPSWLLAGQSYGLPTRKVIDQEWREPTGRVALDWKPKLSFTDETLLYASYVRGYKAGGANPPPAVIVGPCCINFPDLTPIVNASLAHPETFKPEFVNAYEVGTKNTLLDGRLTFNLNAFYYDYTGYQISEIVDRSAVNLNFDAKIWGAELELDWRPMENLRLGFKGGYENTDVAKGSKAIDLMDRAAGDPGYYVIKPFPTLSSNCIIPQGLALTRSCLDYFYNTYSDVPNNGEGVAKDLSGNEFPNAPHFTATITAGYTLPLPNDWLATFQTDLYYQSEAWTRIFNDPGYDKLKAYSNINVAAIFSNEDRGWQVMAYVKNLLNKDNITGAFLNSDDTGLTTNVFLNEPRLYGIRVTKNWTGSSWWNAHVNHSGWYPFRLEVDAGYGRLTGGRQPLVPATVAYFPSTHPYPLGIQNDLDWASVGGAKFTYQPQPKGWLIAGSVRYGRADGQASGHDTWYNPGGNLLHGFQKYVKPWPSYSTSTAKNEETYAIADFTVGREVGLGSWESEGSSVLEGGLEYAHFASSSNVLMHGRPDSTVPTDNVLKYGNSMHRFHATMLASHEFEGAGPAVAWSDTIALRGGKTSGRLGLDVGLGGSVLFGRQATDITGQIHGDFSTTAHLGNFQESGPTYATPLDIHRSRTASAPSVNANLGLSYKIDGLKVSGGYRVDRYFNAIDGGIAERKTYDRRYDGPYFKVSVGFGG